MKREILGHLVKSYLNSQRYFLENLNYEICLPFWASFVQFCLSSLNAVDVDEAFASSIVVPPSIYETWNSFSFVKTFVCVLDIGISQLTSSDFILNLGAGLYKPKIPQYPPFYLQDYCTNSVAKIELSTDFYLCFEPNERIKTYNLSDVSFCLNHSCISIVKHIFSI